MILNQPFLVSVCSIEGLTGCSPSLQEWSHTWARHHSVSSTDIGGSYVAPGTAAPPFPSTLHCIYTLNCRGYRIPDHLCGCNFIFHCFFYVWVHFVWSCQIEKKNITFNFPWACSSPTSADSDKGDWEGFRVFPGDERNGFTFSSSWYDAVVPSDPESTEFSTVEDFWGVNFYHFWFRSVSSNYAFRVAPASDENLQIENVLVRYFVGSEIVCLTFVPVSHPALCGRYQGPLYCLTLSRS